MKKRISKEKENGERHATLITGFLTTPRDESDVFESCKMYFFDYFQEQGYEVSCIREGVTYQFFEVYWEGETRYDI
ncbi:hypothetical protein [Tetragenococcus halophilus]|uniref:hypothetical protein n=1 Tax=Tetragenococcus halophilus TaxID=51669 RepID=UPI0030103626